MSLKNHQKEEYMKYYVVDAFSEQPFRGNPAGVCLLEQEIEVGLMQKIAFENNLSETAFLVKKEGYYDLRWFTPEAEIDLCGHATLGSAHILMSYVDRTMEKVDFHTLSGVLTVTKNGDYYTMDFPSRKPVACKKPELLEEALGVKVLETYCSRDLLAIVDNEETVASMKPNFSLLGMLGDVFAVIVSAKGSDCDFVSRFFIPNFGIPEDPVTGSSHTELIPFWSERLSKSELTARQLSRRGGYLKCRDMGERVLISGKAVAYLEGELLL